MAFARRILFSGLAIAGGCNPSTSEPLGATRAAIIHGSDSPDAEDAVVAVAMRPSGAFGGFCSGTLVAPNLVLTARHCVGHVDLPVGCTADGAAYVGGGTHDYLASEIAIYRGKNALADLVADLASGANATAYGTSLVVESDNLCNADLAFVVLDRDVTGPIAPVRLAAPPTVGEQVTAIGFGRIETGDLPSARRHRTDVFVTRVGSMPLEGMAPYGLGDAELTVGESGCSGDSGGPIVAEPKNGAPGAITGVLSRAGGGDAVAGNPASTCTGAQALAIYTHLAHKPALVARAFGAAGHAPWVEAPPSIAPSADASAPDAAVTVVPDTSAPSKPRAPATAPVPSSSTPTAPSEEPSEEPSARGEPSHASCAVVSAPAPTSVAAVVAAFAFALALRARRRAKG